MTTSLKHELRTPLNHIIGYCELLLEEEEDQAVQAYARDLQRIHQAGKRLLNVIQDLLDPAKPAGAQADPSRIQHEVRTPLNQIIGYAELLQEEARERGQAALATDLEKVLAAARLLLHTVTNHLAHGFHQTNPTEPAALKGATTFVRRDALAVGTPERDMPAPAASGKILVADDDATNRDILQRRLERLGYAVTLAVDGRPALAALRREPFDLLLLDIQMPELDGYQVLRQMRQDTQLQDIPVIVLSASDESERVAQCVALGAEDVLTKPFDPVLLQARLGACLEKKRLRDREVSYLRQIQEEKQRSDELLQIILPHDVAAELKATQMVKPRRIENVTVLFCDIVGFTAYCDQHSPEEVMLYLQAWVQALERLTIDHGLEKIKTIGDAFMATAGMLGPTANPAVDCVRCGSAMIEAARQLPPYWEIRVGLHTGPVIAGIVGRRKFQYDIWGDTVNTAMRMVQAAPPGAICVNAETWSRLEAHCQGTSLGRIPVKGKGQQEVFRVQLRVASGV